MSSGSPRRRSGVLASIAVRSPSSVRTMSSALVAVEPTAIALTRMRGAHSVAISRVRWVSAALAVPYAANPRSVIRPIAELMLTIEPPAGSLASIAGIAAFDSSSAVVTLKWKAFSNMAADVSSSGRGKEPPTLLTTMSRRPNWPVAVSTRPGRVARSLRSAVTHTARRPSRATCCLTSSSWSAVRALMTRSAPASARASAVARPMPRPAPVTMATWSVTRKWSVIMPTT